MYAAAQQQQVYYEAQQTTTMMASPRTSAGAAMMSPRTKSSLQPGQVRNSLAVVPTMHNELAMMEMTIKKLQEENEQLKLKMIQIRSSQLQKCFMATDEYVKQAAFAEWERAHKEMKRLRELQGIEQLRAGDKDQFIATMNELQNRIQELDKLLQEKRGQGNELRNRLNQTNAFIAERNAENQHLADVVQRLEADFDAASSAKTQAMEAEALRMSQLEKAEALIAHFAQAAGDYDMKTQPACDVVVAAGAQCVAYMQDKIRRTLTRGDVVAVPAAQAMSVPRLVY